MGRPACGAAARPRDQRGASAVEFALVSVVFFPLLFGLIDYGLWFSDSLNVRSGVREGVRRSVVQADTGTCATDVSYTTQFAKMRCVVKQEVGSISGPTYVMVKTTADGWVKGKPLVVCAMVKSNGVTGITPLPSNRVLASRTQMSIEVDTPRPTGVNATGASSTSDTLPGGFGATWSWCT